MKFALALMVVLPLAFASPVEKRFLVIIDTILSALGLDSTQLKMVVTDLAVAMEGDETEQQCEAVCPAQIDKVLSGDPADTVHTITHSACPLICKSFQSLLHTFNINVLHLTTPAA